MARSWARLDELIGALGPLPAARPRPALIVLVGLPATGKSTLAAAIRARSGATVVASDALRDRLFHRPRHTPRESAVVFRTLHAVVRALLAGGADVVADATFRRASERRRLYRIAEETGAALIVVAVTAPESELRRRLEARDAAADDAAADDAAADTGSGASPAGLAVYEWMREGYEPIRRPHHVVDTGRDIATAVEAIAREIEAT